MLNAQTVVEDKTNFLKDYKIGYLEDAFALYLNRAIVILEERLNLDQSKENFSPKKFSANIENLSSDLLNKLRYYLWEFAIDCPENFFPEIDKQLFCRQYLKQIMALRDAFSHNSSRPGKEFLQVPQEFYKILEGGLKNLALQKCLRTGSSGSEIAGITLVRRISRGKPSAMTFLYELTPQGILFLCCMALYSDEAGELCAQVHGMKNSDLHAKELRTFYTFCSFRRGRQILPQLNFSIMQFADIVTYLNTVPQISLQFLALTPEKERLEKAKKESLSRPGSAETAFRLQERHQEKFAQYALGYLEDFQLLPVLHFKRYDISDNIGRGKFLFEENKNNDTRMNRHYLVENGSVQFSWKPVQHWGRIRISELRGTISGTELKQMLYAIMKFKASSALNEALNNYFSAYHALLEKILEKTISGMPLIHNEFQKELSVIGNGSYTAEALLPVLGMRLCQLIGLIDQKQKKMSASPAQILKNKITQCREFAECLKREKMPDAPKIRKVFELFNLILEGEWPFRQLPQDEQHRACLDYEYQTVQGLIGNYSQAPNALWKHFEKMDAKRTNENFGPATKLSAVEIISFCDSRKKISEKCRFLHRAKNLDELALMASVECCSIFKKQLELCEKDMPLSHFFQKMCVPPETGFDRNAVISCILKIDENLWKRAFNREEKKPYENRALSDCEHIVPQILLPPGFTSDILTKPMFLEQSSGCLTTEGKFDFNRAFREMVPPLALREYYDVSTLIQWLKDNARSRSVMPVQNSRRNDIDKAMRKIREFHAQDKILAQAAADYWLAGHKESTHLPCLGNNPVELYELFSREIPLKQQEYSIRIRFNDLNKPILETIMRRASKLFSCIPDRHEATLTELMQQLHTIQAEDRKIRKKYIYSILCWEEKADSVRPPQLPSIEELYVYLQQNIFQHISSGNVKFLLDFRNAVFHDHLGLEHDFKPDLQIAPLLEQCEITLSRPQHAPKGSTSSVQTEHSSGEYTSQKKWSSSPFSQKKSYPREYPAKSSPYVKTSPRMQKENNFTLKDCISVLQKLNSVQNMERFQKCQIERWKMNFELVLSSKADIVHLCAILRRLESNGLLSQVDADWIKKAFAEKLIFAGCREELNVLIKNNLKRKQF